jgi:DNA-directed RNA polymerase specialized sigma24 family protein
MTARNALVPVVGFLMLVAGVVLTGLTDAVAIALIVVGAGMFLIGILLPALTEFEIGPGGFSAKLRERDDEARVALEPDSERLGRIAMWLSGDPSAGKALAEEALAEIRVHWQESRREDPRAAARRRLVELAAKAAPAVGPGGVVATPATSEPAAEELLSRVASLPVEERSALVLRLIDGMGTDQIAGALGRPPSTVEADLERAAAGLVGVGNGGGSR